MSRPKRNKYAFLLGISNYDNFNSYKFPDKVIKEFQDLLIETGQYDPNSINFLRTDCEKKSQPIINKIRTKFKYFISEVLKKDEICQIIIYFLCHGGQFNKKNYIFPMDVEPYAIEETSIEINWFIDQIKPLGDNWDVLFIIDACRVDMEDGLLLRKIDGFTKEILDRSCPAGINILWACAPGDSSVVTDDKNTGEKFSIFSRVFLNGLTNVLKGPISNEQLSEYMIDEVQRIALEYEVHIQEPWLKVDALELGRKKIFFTCEGEEYKISEKIKLRRRCDFLIKSAEEATEERDFEEAWDYLEEANLICKEILHDSDLLKEIRRQRRIIRSIKKQNPDIKLEESEIVPYRDTESMFICYSYKDEELVNSFLGVYRTLGLKIYTAETSIMSGKWEEQIKWLIEKSDIFLLFWSTSAAQSKSVAAEYKYALKLAEQKGEHFIRPCYWETPMPSLPEELNYFHFHKIRPESLPDLKLKEQAISQNNKIVYTTETPLDISELDALKELEDFLGEKLNIVEEIKRDNKWGYTVRNNKITGINLRLCGITSLPESIGNFKSLELLRLDNNKLKTLPESIGDLTTLRILHLHDNKILILPKSIGNLKSLQDLFLYRNRLKTLPESIGNLKSLQYLDSSHNQLTALPESIGNLSSLEELDLSRNQLTALPESIGNLSLLQKLELRGNQLTTLPESIYNLKSINYLHVSFNKLSQLPKSIGNLSSLQSLDLCANKFKNLPESISNLSSLKTLWIADNPLKIKKALEKKLKMNGVTIDKSTNLYENELI